MANAFAPMSGNIFTALIFQRILHKIITFITIMTL